MVGLHLTLAQLFLAFLRSRQCRWHLPRLDVRPRGEGAAGENIRRNDAALVQRPLAAAETAKDGYSSTEN